MILRPATPADAVAVAALDAAAFPGSAWSGLQVSGELERAGACALVAEESGGLTGFVLGWALVGEAELTRIAVHPRARRAGHGRRLLDGWLQAIRAAEAEAAFLEVRDDNAPAIGLYLRGGFTEVGRRRGYYADGCDARVLRWEAAP